MSTDPKPEALAFSSVDSIQNRYEQHVQDLLTGRKKPPKIEMGDIWDDGKDVEEGVSGLNLMREEKR